MRYFFDITAAKASPVEVVERQSLKMFQAQMCFMGHSNLGPNNTLQVTRGIVHAGSHSHHFFMICQGQQYLLLMASTL